MPSSLHATAYCTYAWRSYLQHLADTHFSSLSYSWLNFLTRLPICCVRACSMFWTLSSVLENHNLHAHSELQGWPSEAAGSASKDSMKYEATIARQPWLLCSCKELYQTELCAAVSEIMHGWPCRPSRQSTKANCITSATDEEVGLTHHT